MHWSSALPLTASRALSVLIMVPGLEYSPITSLAQDLARGPQGSGRNEGSTGTVLLVWEKDKPCALGLPWACVSILQSDLLQQTTRLLVASLSYHQLPIHSLTGPESLVLLGLMRTKNLNPLNWH